MLQWDRGFQRAAPTVLSGSRIKPPTMPEVSDSRDADRDSCPTSRVDCGADRLPARPNPGHAGAAGSMAIAAEKCPSARTCFRPPFRLVLHAADPPGTVVL